MEVENKLYRIPGYSLEFPVASAVGPLYTPPILKTRRGGSTSTELIDQYPPSQPIYLILFK
jgi:hypothetical protein